MKIAYFALSETYGGRDAGFVHAHSIVSFLNKKGEDVTFFIAAPDSNVKPDVKTVLVTLPRLSNILRVNPISYIKSFFDIRKKLGGIDIIHERFHINPIDLVFLGNRKYVLEVNDPAIELCSGLKKYIYKWLIRMKYDRADAIIVQTETLKNIISKHTNTKIYVVPNGVDTTRFRPDVVTDFRRRYGISKSDVLVTFVGSFREWHGVLDIIEMARRIPQAKFLLIGSGTLFEPMKKASCKLRNIILLGAVDYDEIPGIMANSDVLIAPFNTEGFEALEKYGFWWCPVKLFEYMASGKSVVSYDFPEVRKIIGTGGLLAKKSDIEDFIKQLNKLVLDGELRSELGAVARNLAKNKYDWKKRTDEIALIYDMAMRDK